MEKSNSNGSPKRWLDNKGKGRLIPNGDINKSIEEAQKEFDQMQRDEMLQIQYDRQTTILEKLKNLEVDPPPGLNYFFISDEKEATRLYHELSKDSMFIDPKKTSLEAFKIIFSGRKIIPSTNRITWVCMTPKKASNKTALREFLTLLLGKFNNKVVPLCFIDLKGSPIHLNKPKPTEESRYKKKLKTIIQGSKP